MADLIGITEESELSDHSSLEEEDIDLERERRRKLNKEGYHSLYSTAIAAKAVGKARKYNQRDRSKTVAAALKVAGAVALAGAAWTPNNTTQKPSLAGQSFAAAAAAKVKRNKRDPAKTVAAALKIAGGVALLGASWTKPTEPKTENQKANNNLSLAGAAATAQVINKAKKVKRKLNYSIYEALRIAGGVAIAAGSWCPQFPIEKSERTEMVSAVRESKIELEPQLETPRPQLEQNPKSATQVIVPQVCTMETQTDPQTPPPKFMTVNAASSPIQVFVANRHNRGLTPVESSLLKPVTKPTKYSSLRKLTPAQRVSARVGRIPVIVAEDHVVASSETSQYYSPTPSVPPGKAETSRLLHNNRLVKEVTPAPSIPPRAIVTPDSIVLSPVREETTAHSIPSKATETPNLPIIIVTQNYTPVDEATPQPSVPLHSARTPIVKEVTPAPSVPLRAVETPYFETPAPSIPARIVETPAVTTPTPAPSVPSQSPETPAINSPSPSPTPPLPKEPTPTKDPTPTPSVPSQSPETPAIKSPSPSPTPPKEPTPTPPKEPTPTPPKVPTPIPTPNNQVNSLAPAVVATTVTKRRAKRAIRPKPNRAPTPEEQEIEEVPLVEEKPVETAVAENPVVKAKPKKKSRAKMTPLERLVARTRSLA